MKYKKVPNTYLMIDTIYTRIKKIIFSILSTLVERQGVILIKATKKKDIIDLIKKLHPYKTPLVRLGARGDGGYLVPNDLDGIEACFSPGVDQISEFEMDCLHYGMKIFMADKSVERPNINAPKEKYSFLKKFVGCTNNTHYTTMNEWVMSQPLLAQSDLLLQMDIEGGEYETIINMSDDLIKRFRIIVIEFHRLHELWNPHYFHINKIVFEKILQTHVCVHLHPNNCGGIDKRLGVHIPRLMECTFLRKDRLTEQKFTSDFPHKFDCDNTDDPSIVLPRNWYK